VSQARAPCLGGLGGLATLTAWVLLLGTPLTLPSLALAAAGDSSLEIRVLATTGPAPPAAEVASGALDRSFLASASQAWVRQVPGTHWVRLQATRGIAASAVPVVVVGASRYLRIAVYPQGSGTPSPLSGRRCCAKTDPLTGVLNRRSLLEHLEAACRHARASGLPVAVLFLDLDFFKSINDSYGHAAGDACLAERIRLRVSEALIEGHGAPIQLTCSIGVASSDPLGVWGEALIAQADSAVYAAKRLGRNRVQVATPLAA
jgi:GGDEF domain-containing protein